MSSRNCSKCNRPLIQKPLFTTFYEECPVCDGGAVGFDVSHRRESEPEQLTLIGPSANSTTHVPGTSACQKSKSSSTHYWQGNGRMCNCGGFKFDMNKGVVEVEL